MGDERTESQARRRRWINLGELIALAALIVSALGVWISWKGNGQDKPTRVVEQRQAIPLTLRAKADGERTDADDFTGRIRTMPSNR